MATEGAKLSFHEALKQLVEAYKDDPEGQVEVVRHIICTMTIRCDVSIYPDLEQPGQFTISLDPMAESNEYGPTIVFGSEQSSEPKYILSELGINAEVEQWELSEE